MKTVFCYECPFFEEIILDDGDYSLCVCRLAPEDENLGKAICCHESLAICLDEKKD